MDYRFSLKKLFPLFVVYIAFSLIGSITFSIAESTCFDNFGTGKKYSRINLSKLTNTLQCLAVNQSSSANTHKNTPFSSRAGMIRIYMIAGISAVVIYFLLSPFYTAKSKNFFNPENTILLKLRI
jgi:hypothetical protein